MVGIGTIVNTIAIIVGGNIGIRFKKIFSQNLQDAMKKACGLGVLFIGIAGAMEKMLGISNGELVSSKSMLVVVCMTIGTFIGESINIDGKIENFGKWLKTRTGNVKDNEFINAFDTASFTVCIGAMAIVGSIEDGINGNYSILAVKAILDFIIIAVLVSSLGVGAIYSAIPVFIFQGSITLLAKFISPFMTELVINYISLIGSILIFCVGINLIWGNIIKIANMLPSMVVAIVFAMFNLM